MTADQWKEIDGKLQNVWSPVVKLKIDGYEVSLALRQVSQFRNAILVYINGEFRGKWLTEDCEERRRFFPCKKRCVTNANELKKMGIRSKKEIQKYKEMATYHIDLAAAKLHWWKFRALMLSLSEHTEFVKIMGYRAVEINSKMTAAQKTFYQKMKKHYKLPVKKEVQQKISAIEDALINGESIDKLL